MHFFLGHDQEFCLPRHVTEARLFFGKVAETGMNTFVQVRVQIPSGLNIEAWKTYLEKYAAKTNSAVLSVPDSASSSFHFQSLEVSS